MCKALEYGAMIHLDVNGLTGLIYTGKQRHLEIASHSKVDHRSLSLDFTHQYIIDLLNNLFIALFSSKSPLCTHLLPGFLKSNPKSGTSLDCCCFSLTVLISSVAAP